MKHNIPMPTSADSLTAVDRLPSNDALVNASQMMVNAKVIAAIRYLRDEVEKLKTKGASDGEIPNRISTE